MVFILKSFCLDPSDPDKIIIKSRHGVKYHVVIKKQSSSSGEDSVLEYYLRGKDEKPTSLPTKEDLENSSFEYVFKNSEGDDQKKLRSFHILCRSSEDYYTLEKVIKLLQDAAA